MPLADTLADPLIGAYAEVWDGLVGELETLTDPGAWRRRERIRELLVTIDKEFRSLDPAVRQFTDRDLKDVYGLGHAWSATTAGVQGVFAIQYNETLGALENGLRDRLLAENRAASALMQRQVRAAARTATRSSVAAGTPAQAAARQMTETLRGAGLHSVTYNDGSRRSIKTYSEMAVRTTTAQAYNEGSFQLGSQIGVMFYEVFDGPTCGWSFHEDGDLADGKIVTDDEAREYPISHPNCRRTFGARPDLNKKPDGKVEHRVSPPTSAAEARERARLESGGLLRERRRPGRRSQPGAPRPEAQLPPRSRFGDIEGDEAFARQVADREKDFTDHVKFDLPRSSVELVDGEVALSVTKNDYFDGWSLVQKKVATEAEQATEILASRVSRAVGFDRRVDVFDDTDGGLIMDFVKGKPVGDPWGRGGLQPITDVDRHRSALLDFLTDNPDRHVLNGIVDDAGKMIPIDNGAATFRATVRAEGPDVWKISDVIQFGETKNDLLGITRAEGGSFSSKRFVANQFEPGELDTIAARLEGFRDEFVRYGRGDDLDNMLDRLALLREQAQGGQSILGG